LFAVSVQISSLPAFVTPISPRTLHAFPCTTVGVDVGDGDGLVDGDASGVLEALAVGLLLAVDGGAVLGNGISDGDAATDGLECATVDSGLLVAVGGSVELAEVFRDDGRIDGGCVPAEDCARTSPTGPLGLCESAGRPGE
jgi:hypothetical protein